MALTHGSEHYTKWMHIENRKVLVRRLHRIEIQARDGRLYAITGDRLPDSFGTFSGHAYKGEHLAQILLRPDSCATYETPRQSASWPSFRDAVNMFIGFMGIVMLRFIIGLIEAM